MAVRKFAQNLLELGSERLKRAKEQGFDTGTVYYHATDKLQDGEEFKEFIPSVKGKLGPGVYAAKSPDYSERYIRTSYQSGTNQPVFGEGSRMVPIFVRGKMGSIEDYGKASDKAKDLLKKEFDKIDAAQKNNEFDELMANRQKLALQKKKAHEILSEEGFSGFEVSGEVVIFDPKNIRSVNAQFDPKKTDSKNLLASVAPLLIGGGLLANQDAQAGVLSSGVKALANIKPLSKDEFYKKYDMHADMRGASDDYSDFDSAALRKQILEEGLAKGWVNSAYKGSGSMPKALDRKYGSKKGMTAYLVPKSHVTEDGRKIKKPYKIQEHEIIDFDEDGQSAYDAYLKNFKQQNSKGSATPGGLLGAGAVGAAATPTFQDKAVAVGETLLDAGQAMIAPMAAAGHALIPALTSDRPTAQIEQGYQNLLQQMNYEPSTQLGQEYSQAAQQFMGDAFNAAAQSAPGRAAKELIAPINLLMQQAPERARLVGRSLLDMSPF